MPASHGEDAVLRVLDKETLSEEFSSLPLDVVGFSVEETRRFRRYIREPYGMVLVTGPTGSGKTTTLYAAINEIKSDEDKIVTIEDPVEYQLRGITQIPVNEKKGLTFARGLRSILRHDPDKIMVGEIRDQETAQIAIQSALTGHLVFTTVHANNVTDVIGRFINMGVEPYNFVSALNCIMAQRLVRVICKSCKRPKRYSPQELQEAGLDPAVWSDVTFAEGAGCLECSGTGYHGRTAICELLDLTDRIREMIVDRRPTSEIKRVAAARWSRTGSLDAYAVESLPPGALIPSAVEVNIVNSAAVKAAVATACGRLRARDEDVAMILPDTVIRVFVQHFEEFPRSAEEAVPMLRWKLKKSVPFESDETLISFMRQAPRETGLEVVTALARLRIIREYESLAEGIGLFPGVVLSSSLAAISLLEDERPTLLARVSGSSLTTAIVRRGVLCGYRCTELPAHGANLTPQMLLEEIFPVAAYYQ